MGVDAEELIVRPFREVVERGADAVANAEAAAEAAEPDLSERMLKAARAVAREGERALKKIQPIWDGQVEKYGDTFKEAMMDQDELERKRRLLEDLLYDFEDYTDADSFDPDRYAEVQAATKSFALDVINIVKRLKLELPKPADPPMQSFPPLPPLPPSIRAARSSIPPLSRSSTKASDTKSRPGTVSPIPASPTLAPSDDEDLPIMATPRTRKGSLRRSAPSPQRTATKSSSHSSSLGVRQPQAEDRRPSSPDILGNGADRPRPANGLSNLPHDSPPSTIPRTSSWVRNHAVPPRPRPLVRPRASRDTVATDHSTPDSPNLSRFNSLTIDSSSRSVSVFDSAATPLTAGTRTPDTRTSFLSNSNSFASLSMKESPMIMPEMPVMPEDGEEIPPSKSRISSFPMPPSDNPQDFIKFEPVAEVPPVSLPSLTLPSAADTDADSGLMLADEVATISETTSSLAMPTTRQYTREADCSIGQSSSFRQMQGFCKGAEAFRIGGHWQGIKQVAGFVANRQSSIGRCVGCGYGHNYEEVQLDMEKKPEATFNQCGARFRVRLLYKSHISNTINNQRQAESHYACLFCVQNGATVREGEATVFTSSDTLLLHLARHPQPLPPVPGLTVLYGSAIAPTDPHVLDFDLHLPNPPLPTPVPESVGKAAVATAVKEHVQRYGQKKLPRPDNFGGDLLQFLAGGRIVGVTFPEKWGGKWCLGWHDGAVGAFPAKVVDVEPPRQSEIPMESSSSGMSVTTRWKWHPKSEGEGKAKGSVWLEFDKGEVISNVRCLYADHWCWSGTNSKGRTGVFPQSHVLLDSLRQEGAASSKGSKKSGGRSKGFFGRRPMSSSNASSLSGGTTGRISALS